MKKITAFSGAVQVTLLQSVQTSVERVVNYLGNDAGGRSGGYFRMWLVNEDDLLVPICNFLVGEVDGDKFEKYHFISNEKGMRLARNLKHGHVSSWQSRNPDNDEYGGAIYFIIKLGDESFRVIFSFSGLPEKGDEAAMIMAANDMDQLRLPACSKIIDASENDIAIDLGLYQL